MSHSQPHITDGGLNSISKHMHQLRKLHNGGCPSITNSGTRQLAVGCSLLQEFCVRNRSNLSIQCAYEILRTCPKMRRLHCQESWSCHWLHPCRLQALTYQALRAHDVVVNSTAMAILASCCIQLRELHVHKLYEEVIMPDPLRHCPPMPALVKMTIGGLKWQ
eukprot:SM000123S25851  [mRNA]  locus=s123:272890:273394:+ [translate_table: standard]